MLSKFTQFLLQVIVIVLCCSLYPFAYLQAQNTSTTKPLSNLVEDSYNRPTNFAIENLPDEEKNQIIKIQRLLRAYDRLEKFSGVAIITKNGQPIYKYTAGYASISYKAHCALETQFNLSQITQSITAIAILQLAEQGKLQIDKPIANYLKKLPPKIKNITIKQLLTHSSGLANYYDLESYKEQFLEIESRADLLKLVFTQPLLFQPGTQVKSSHSNYVILAAIMEAVSEQSYKDYINEKIIKPLNLAERSGLYNWNEAIEFKAVGYTTDENFKQTASADFYGAYPFGAEALYASVEDLFLLDKALKNKTLLSGEYEKMMYTPYMYTDSLKREGVGLGWQIRKVGTKHDKTAICQGGFIGGISTQIRRYVDDNYSVMVLCNKNINTANEIANEMEEIFYNPAYYIPYHPLAYFINYYITQKGADYLSKNFDSLLVVNNFEVDTVWTLHALGREYVQAKQYKDALSVLDINKKLYPKEPLTYDLIGDIYFRQKDYDKVIAIFEEKLVYHPKDIRAPASIKSAKKAKMRNAQHKQKEMLAKTIGKGKNIDFSVLDDTDENETDETTNIANAATATNKNKKTAGTVQRYTAPKSIETFSNTINNDSNNDKEAVTISNQIESANNIPTRIGKTDTGANSNNIVSTASPIASNKKMSSPPKTTVNPAAIAAANKKTNNSISTSASKKAFTVVEKMPEFPGGQIALFNYISNDLNYPAEAKENKIEGTVHIQFIVAATGKVEQVQLDKGLTDGGMGCNEEALRLVRAMPNWTAGEHKGQKVNVSYTIPVRFRLNK